MLKNFLAFYGAMKLLEDAGRKTPPDDKNNGSAIACGCLTGIVIIVIVLCAAS